MSIHWNTLGTVSPGFTDWVTFPSPSIDDSLFRITCTSSNWLHIRSFVWFRSRWPNGLVSQARRIYPKQEIQIINDPIPADLERDGWVLRDIQLKRNYRDMRWASQIDGPLSLTIEGGHYLNDSGQPTLSDPELQILLDEIHRASQKIEEYLGGDPL